MGNLFTLIKKRVTFLFVSLFTFLFGLNVSAQTSTCIVNGGDWSSPTTWDNGVPVAGINAVIPAGFIPTVTSNVACDNLTFSATTTSTLTLGGNLTVNGNLVLNQSIAANTTTLAVGANILTVTGTVTYSSVGTSTISATSGTLNFGSLITLGTLDRIVFTGAGTGNFNAGLTDGAGDLTVASGTTVNMLGNYTVSSGSAVWATGSNTIFSTSVAITANSLIAFYNVTVTGGTPTLTGSASVYGTWIINSGAAFTIDGAIAGTGTKTFTVSNGATLNLIGTSTLPGFGTISLGSSSLVNYAGSGAQTVAAANYGNLTFSNSGTRILASSGTIGISNTFTPGTNSCTITGSTINYNGTTNQTISAFNYNNLTLSGVRTTNSVTLENGGTIGVAGTFAASSSFTSGSYIVTNSTINFNSTGAQSITSFNYYNLTISGARTSNNVTLSSGTIGVSNVFNPAASFTSGSYVTNSSNIFEFNGTDAQTVPAFNYAYLKISGTRSTNNVTLANGGVIGIAGANNAIILTASFTSGSYVNTNTTINFNSSSPQNITIPANGFINNLSFNCTGVATLTNAITTSNVTGNLAVQSGTLNNGGFSVTGNVGATFSVSNGATYEVAKSTSMPSGYGVVTLGSSSTVNFTSVFPQTIGAYNYGNLILSGTRNGQSVTFQNGGTIGIAGTFTPSVVFTTGSYITTNSTIDFNGSGSQTIPAFAYNNLTSSSSGARTLSATGTIDVKGTFTPGTNSYTITGSTINYSAASAAQTVAAFNYYNLTISGSRSSSNVTFANGGTVGVSNVLTTSATFTSGSYVFTNNTVNFNGSSSQTVNALAYNNLTLTNASTKTLAGTIAITGALTISGATFDVSSSNYGLTVAGNWINNAGTFIPRSGTVIFNGTTIISGSSSTSFNNVTITGSVTGYSGNTNVAGNWLNNGTYTHNSGTITFNGTTTVSGSSTTSFNNVTISGTLTAPASATMNVAGNWVNNGTFTHNSGTIVFNGTTSISGSSSNSFNNITISGTLTGPSSANINVAGNWTNNGIFTHNNGTVTFNGATVMTGSATTSFNNITISGSLTAHPTAINVAGNWTNNGTFLHNFGLVTFNGTTTISGSTSTDFNNVTISGTLTAPSAMGINGNFVNNGTFTHSSGTITFGTTTVSGSSTTTFYNITIGTALTGHNNSMYVAGNMVNNGTYIHNGGLITFNGSTAQTISGSSGTGVFQNLGLNNVNGLTVSAGGYTLIGTIYITAGTLTNAASFALTADATSYARIDEISAFCGSCGFAGNFDIQRYLPGRTSAGIWADLTSPVSNGTMADWDDDLFLVYPFTGFDEIYNRPTGSNVMLYDEPTASYLECSSATALSAGQGFEIALTDDETLSSFTTTVLSTNGTPNFGTYDIPLSLTDANGAPYPTGYSGENLIGNPFASAIDLSLITITNALPSVDVYDYETNNYKTLTGSDLIGPYQGFWAYAQSQGASVIIPESAKSTSNNIAIERNASGSPYFNLTLSSGDGSNTMAHTLKIACNETALDGWDMSDHPYRRSLNPKAPSITSHAGQAVVSINTFNNSHETYIMPLQVKVGINGKYRINTDGIANVTKDYPVVLLEDRSTKKFIDLTTSSAYTFTAQSVDSPDRFVLHYSKSTNYTPNATTNSSTVSEIQISQTRDGNLIRFSNTEVENTTITVMDLLGKRIMDDVSVQALNQTVNISIPETFKGMYIVVVQSANNKTVKKFNAIR
ncbi:MAG TPA: T9SS type A sorting domain-containing protein [Bacteroidia bacterium]|nr:T9SS type A sorting domain-containing protein [Bacteroidia bacterium]